MKPHVWFAALCAVAPVSMPAAESELPPLIKDDFVNLLRIDVRAAKAEIVTNTLELTSAELARFWPIYHAYDADLVKLNTERIATLREFFAHYARISNPQAEELTRRSFEFQKRRLALLEKYYGKVAKAFNSATAARFIQLEHQLLMLIDVQIASEMPLIPREAVVEQLKGK